MLATVAQAGDTPRKGHIAAAYDLPKVALEVLGGDLTDSVKIDHLINRGSINQAGGYRSAFYSLAPGRARAGVLVVLRRQLVELLGSELLANAYAGINRGWVLAIYRVAKRVGDEEVAALALKVYTLIVTVEMALACPADAHPKLRLRCVAPGGRSGDRNGMSSVRDESRALETTGRPLVRTYTGQLWVEVWMVRHAIEEGILPRIAPAPLSEVRTRWPLRVRYFTDGHEADFFQGMPTAMGALDRVSVRYDMAPGPGDARWQHGMAVESSGWDTWAPRWKSSRPAGWNFPWRPGAPALPERDLGRLVREVVIGEGADVDRPEPTKPPPGPKPPEPTKPKPSTGPPIPASGHHATFRLPGEKATVIVNVLPGNVWKGRRWKKDGGQWQDFE